MSKERKFGNPDDIQLNLFGSVPAAPDGPKARTAADSGRRFLSGDPRTIYIGVTRLEDYLKQQGQLAPFIVGRLLDERDWTAFEERYAPTGRPPFAPRAMLGVILYGVMQGVSSLRELERLARLDLGCMWISGGITPDHANIGRFITLHDASLTDEFFESLTRGILQATNSRSERVAGDGTVIEAAASYYKMVRAEAIRARAEAASIALAHNPDDSETQEEAKASAQYLAILEERQKARQRSGSSIESLCLSSTEPEAMVQPLKRNRGRTASYKPSVLANENRIVTAIAIHPSSETQVVGAMLDMHERVTTAPPSEVLLDAGYFDDRVIAATLERDISLLCPEGQVPGQSKESKVFHKSLFAYDAATNTYRCPAGQTLFPAKSRSPNPTKQSYGTKACSDCSMRAQCTTLKKRRIDRKPTDEQRDALRQVMAQQQVHSIFAQRKAMVEPVFSHLRQQQGMNRFRRRGLLGTKLEFALHIMAYNLSRAVAILMAFFAQIWAPLRRCQADRRLRAAIKTTNSTSVSPIRGKRHFFSHLTFG